MSIYTRLCADLLFPLHERLKGHNSVAVRRRLEQSQWWPADRIESEQLARLRVFLGDVGRNVPYYRRVFAKIGFDPSAIGSVADLAALPLLTKPLIRAHADELKADDHGPLTRYNTGGSSGEPLIFHMGIGRKAHDVGAKWRATRWWGVDIGDRELVIWGSPVELGAQDRIRQLRDGIMRSRLLPAFEMSGENLDRFVAEIRTFKPAMLFGYPSSLAVIAERAIKNGARLSDIGIRVAFVTSERLYDHQRELIAEVFGCPVANGYGARDAGFIAHQCPHGAMHVSAEDIVVEVVDAAGRTLPQGSAGELVITHMSTRAFPFIRYRTGDVGVLGPATCPCGRGLPILDEIQGRTTDFVVAKDGTLMHGLAFIYTLRDLPGVAQFKILQQSLERTDVQIVQGPGWEAANVDRIRSAFGRRLGEDVDVRVEAVERISPEASGKYRYVVSKVTPSAAAGSRA